MGNNKQQDKKEDEKQKAEEVLTDLEKRIKEYQERAEISYQKKEAKIRQKNSNDQEALKLYNAYVLEYQNLVRNFENINYDLQLGNIQEQTSSWDWVKNWQVKGGNK